MMQMMGMPREYVIERIAREDRTHVYAAYWRDHVGMTPFVQRVAIIADTATDARELMTRHYPGAVCMYTPPDIAALVAAAIAAIEGE